MRRFVVSLAFLVGACRSTASNEAKKDPTPIGSIVDPTADASAAPIGIHELVGMHPPPGTELAIEGVVAATFFCPPCPPGAKCGRKCLESYVDLTDVDSDRPVPVRITVDDAAVASFEVHSVVRLRVRLASKGGLLRFFMIERLP